MRATPYDLDQPPPGMQPTLFAHGWISTAAPELNSVFSPDGLEFYFARRQGDALKTFVLRRDDQGHWSDPQLSSISQHETGWDQVDVWFDETGTTIYYISNAPADGRASDSVNLWRARRNGSSWGPPEPLGDPVNSDGHEIYPMIVGSGDLYFSSTRDGGFGGRDIYHAKKTGDGFSEVVNLGPSVNSEEDEGDVYVSPDESYLIVTSDREGGLGHADLYVSHRDVAGQWSPLRNLGAPINSAEADYCPVVTPDGRYFFFTRAGDIYWVDREALALPEPTVL